MRGKRARCGTPAAAMSLTDHGSRHSGHVAGWPGRAPPPAGARQPWTGPASQARRSRPKGSSSVSPWSSSNPTPTTFTLLAAVWLIIVQWLSSGLGGYLVGRLRTKWMGLHTDEVFFHDTAHGFWPGRSFRFWSPPSPQDAWAEAGRMLTGVANGNIDPGDRTYLRSSSLRPRAFHNRMRRSASTKPSRK